MEKYHLTKEQVEQYHADGYLIVKKFLSEDEAVILYETAIEDKSLKENSYDMVDGNGMKSKLALWFTPGDDSFGMLSRSKRMAQSAGQLLGGEVGHFHSKVMQKEPKVGGAWDWHQDYGYWYRNGFLYPQLISVMIALTKANAENGCLQVLKGSHKMDRIEHGTSGEQVGADLKRVELAMERHELIHCELEAGDALFFHCNLLHSSAANLSDHPRWSIISAYNLLTNKPFLEKTISCITPIDLVEDDMILKVGKKGLGEGDFLTKETDISIEQNKKYAK
ncbi:phytanoyl-CoA dioxygenase family protein [Chitinophaga barathri]|uniref:Phytanoyl-CoA dioxygenase family protein n=1 Tax=Chitinophaga barathri TaxID=1647451 RepID=A0A3N4MHD4_9BACT|nr:phytanoyl-CoA dioxygenase family protein [Chitinophaga barathri]RPD42998.1 phytanoyl-CoA dioxygenase family protein [Chitinophaga barathri]